MGSVVYRGGAGGVCREEREPHTERIYKETEEREAKRKEDENRRTSPVSLTDWLPLVRQNALGPAKSHSFETR